MKIYERRNGGKTDWLLIVAMTSLTFGCASGPSHEEGYKYVNGVNHYYGFMALAIRFSCYTAAPECTTMNLSRTSLR